MINLPETPQVMNKIWMIIVLCFAMSGCACPHNETEMCGRDKRIYCKRCHYRVVWDSKKGWTIPKNIVTWKKWWWE